MIHGMKRFYTYIYILAVMLAMLPLDVCGQRAELRKMSPAVRRIVLTRSSAAAKGMNGGDGGTMATVMALVKVKGDVSDVFRNNGCRTLAAFDDILAVSLPVANLVSVAADRRIERIEAASVSTVHNDLTSQYINAVAVHEGRHLPQAFTGKGVVMGVQDVGFDLTNPNFYSSDMQTYRIKSFWDMLSTDTVGSAFPVGNDYRDEASILAYAHSRDAEMIGHGTYTLGTAAGSGYGSKYAGLAFGSDICLVNNVVSNNMELIDDADLDKYNSVSSLLGFKYIFDYADSVGRPCVISFSEGSHEDLYGDNLLYNEVLGKMVGPGRIIVASAGNKNKTPSYVHKQRGEESAGTFVEIWGNRLYLMAQSDRDFTARMVIYGSERDTVSVSSAWLCQQPDSLASQTVTVDGREYTFLFGAYPSCYDPDRLVVEYVITGPDHIGMSSVCPFSVEFVGTDADIEAYSVVGNFVTRSVNPSLCRGECSHDINFPASSPYVIAVGSTACVTGYTDINGNSVTYDYGTGGVKATFSSVGPTVDGRVKPDVMAPGTNVISSADSYYYEANPETAQGEDLVERFEYNGRAHYWKADTGTSVSSPAVGGAIALWLEACPDLTRERIMDVFAHTCTRPDKSFDYPNNRYGYGQIDVYRGLLYLLGIDCIEGISGHQPESVEFAVTGSHSFDVTFAVPLSRSAEIRVYDTSGRLLHTSSVAAGASSARIVLPLSVKGMVAVQVSGDSSKTTGSTLMRF